MININHIELNQHKNKIQKSNTIDINIDNSFINDTSNTNNYQGLSNKSSKKSYFVRRSILVQSKPSNFFKMTNNNHNNTITIQIDNHSTQHIQKPNKSSSSSTLLLAGLQILSNQEQKPKINIKKKHLFTSQSQTNSILLENSYIIDQNQNNNSNFSTIAVNPISLQQQQYNNSSKTILNHYKKHSYDVRSFQKSRKTDRNSQLEQQLQKSNISYTQSLSKKNAQTMNLPNLIDSKNHNSLQNSSLVRVIHEQNPELLSNRRKIDQHWHQKDPLYKTQEQTQDYKNIIKLKRYQRFWRGKQRIRQEQQQKYISNNIKGISNKNYVFQKKSLNTRNDHYFNHYKSFINGYQKQSVLKRSLQKSGSYINKHNSEVEKRLVQMSFEDYLRDGDKKIESNMKRDIKGVISPHIQGLKGKGSGKGKNIKLYFEEVFMVQEVYKVSTKQ